MSKMILRPYQNELIDAVFEAWEDDKNTVLVQSHTGSGKTVMLTSIVQQANVPTVIIAHRIELVSQLSLALARAEIQHNIVSPTAAITEIIELHLLNGPRHYFNPTAQVIVASVDTLIRRSPAWADKIQLVVFDECFPAGTLVEGKPIESIQAGEEVTAFNEATQLLERRKVLKTFRRIVPKDMVSLEIRGDLLTCTKGHPFFTKRGWVNAENIRTTDFVLRLVQNENPRDYRKSTVSPSEKRENILSKKMRVLASTITTNRRLVTENNKTRSPLYHLRGKSRSVHFQISKILTDKKGVLQQSVRKSLSISNILNYSNKNEFKIWVSTYGEKQSSADIGGQKKVIGNFKKKWSHAQSTRRKWKTSNRSGSYPIFIFKRLRVCITAFYTHSPTKRKTVSLVLQTRFRKFFNKTSNRSRREYPQRKKSFRSKERSMLEWVRVDRIEIQKSRDIAKQGESDSYDYVYNLHVEGLETYLANGVVVHNCSHVLRANKWGKAAAMFPRARGLHVTATPIRADGRGLGREAEGLVDLLIEGPSMRQLITDGYLSEYRIFAPPNALDLSPVKVTASGDYSPDPLRKAVSKAHITGDIVDHFKRHNAPGALGITFAVSVEAAKELAQAYSESDIPAICIHAETGIKERASIMRRFRDGTIQQLVNVDILTEGVDVPAVACVSLARPTASYSLHMQQLGRSLRPSEGKPHAIILDHVGNITKHGLPDVARAWTLKSQDRKARGTTGAIPLRTCLNPTCVAVFERNRDRCPWCSHPIPLPAQRASPAQVEGNLLELGAPTLAYLNDEIKRIGSAPRIPYGVSGIIASSIIKKHHARQEAQLQLQEAIAEWAGVWHAAGESDAEILRRFWYQFGIDTLSAQTLSRGEALKLIDRIRT